MAEKDPRGQPTAIQNEWLGDRLTYKEAKRGVCAFLWRLKYKHCDCD